MKSESGSGELIAQPDKYVERFATTIGHLITESESMTRQILTPLWKARKPGVEIDDLHPELLQGVAAIALLRRYWVRVGWPSSFPSPTDLLHEFKSYLSNLRGPQDLNGTFSIVFFDVVIRLAMRMLDVAVTPGKPCCYT